MPLPLQLRNKSTNPSCEATSGALVNARTNLFANPAFETNTTGVTANWGTTGAGTLSRPTSGGYSGSGVSHARMQWTTASTAIGGYIQNITTSIGVGNWTISAYVRVNAAQRIQLVISNADTLAFTTTSNPAVDLVANVWTRVTATINVTTAGTAAARWTAVTGGSGHNWAIGNQLDLDGCLMEMGSTAGAYFDGGTAASGIYTYAWSGASHASTSYEQAPDVQNFAGAAGQTINYRSNASPEHGTYMCRGFIVTNAAIGLNPQDSFVADGVARTAIMMVRSNKAVTVQPRWRTAAAASANEGGTTVLTPNVWTEIRFSGTPSLGAPSAPSLLISGGVHVSGDTIDIDRHFVIEDGAYTGAYFDGSTEEAGWSHVWTGTANASDSTRDATGLWVDVDLTGTAHTQLTVLGLGMSQSVTKIVRSDGKASFPVPGWLRRLTIDADTETDWTVPLGRPVTYTLFKDGIAIASRVVTVEAETGDIMDPLDPQGALKIRTTSGDPTVLALGADSVKSVRHENTSNDREYPLGARYAISRPGVRAAVQDVPFVFNAHRNEVSDNLQAIVEQAPILLVRTLPSWGAIPPLIYTDAPVEENPFNRGRGGEFTQWTLEATAVAPVTRAVTAGKVTNAEVQANLTGRTHDSIKAASGTKRHVEIKANPLSLGQ